MRPGPIALAVLREALPEVSVVSVVPDVDHRTYPMVTIRREGGTRLPGAPRRLSHPVLEMTAVSADGPVQAEELYEEALDALFDAVQAQTAIPGISGCLHNIHEERGAAQVESKYPDTWAVEGSVRLGVKPS